MKNLQSQNTKSIKQSLAFVELEDRLELVQLSAVAASESTCGGYDPEKDPNSPINQPL